MAEIQWYYAQNQEQAGPVSFRQLQQLAAAGALRPSDKVWNDEMPDWLPAETVRGLFAAAAPTDVADPPRGPSGVRLKQVSGTVRARLRDLTDPATWLFGVGLFFLILCLFLPALDAAKAEALEGALEAGQANQDRLQREYERKEKRDSRDEEIRKKGKEGWDREKVLLQESALEVRGDAKRWRYWYTWGMLLGVVLVTVAALAYLDPAQPPVRRTVGAIVIAGEVLIILARYAAGAGLVRAVLG